VNGRLDPVRLTPELIDRLRAIVGPEHALTDPERQLPYLREWRDKYEGQSSLVLRPGTTGQVSQILALAHEHGLPVVPQAGNTGLVGGQIPTEGEILLSVGRLRRVRAVDPAGYAMTVEAGLTLAEAQAAADQVERLFPLSLPSEGSCQIGGNIAINAGGTSVLAYGNARQLVLGLEVVLADGRVWDGLKGLKKDNSGYDLKDLFIGSEGTLGVITKVLLKLVPPPAAKKTLVATFAQMDHAAQTVSDLIAARIIPCTLEFLDRTTIHCVEDYAKIGLPLDCEALLLMESDGHPAAVAEEAARMAELARKNGALEVRVARDDAEAARLATARRSAFSALARVAPTTILEDATVPRSELAKMIRFVDAVAKKHRLRIGTFGHMGDGNLHPTFLTDERNAGEMHRVEEAFQEIFAEAIRLGGTITGEHGIGVAKKSFLPKFAGDAQMRVMRELKKVLDPNGILNPGKMFE
jgi:glycolate oxidase